MKRRTVFLLLGGLLALSLAGGRLFVSRRGEGPAAAGRPRPVVTVECAPMERGEIRDQRGFTGTLLPRARVVFAPKVPGRLIELRANLGDPVLPGQVLARLDDQEHALQVEQARAALEVARAAVEQQSVAAALAERERERVRRLRERGIASEAEWDAVESESRVQASRLRTARAQEAERSSALRSAEVRLGDTRILPMENAGDGSWFVEERHVDEGAMLAANAPILTAVDIGRLTAVIHLIERDYPAMRVGLPVRIETDAFPGEEFEGRVVRVAPALREASRQARVEIEVPNRPVRLRPGMFVRARVEFDRREDARLAPRSALVIRDGRTGLFVVDPEEGRARFVAVRPGIRSGDRVEILEPDLEGRVVTLGHHLLADGAPVRVCEDGPDR